MYGTSYFLLQHEDASVQMLDHLLDVNDLKPSLEKYGITDNCIDFIKHLIQPKQVRRYLSCMVKSLCMVLVQIHCNTNEKLQFKGICIYP